MVADWIAWRLCGRLATDPSLAGRTMAHDPLSGGWIAEFLAEAGIAAGQCPPILPAGTPLGRLRPAWVAELGLDKAPCVVVGGYDRALAAIGAGAARPNCVLDSLGTAEGLMLFTATPPAPAVVTGQGLNLCAAPGTAGPLACLFGGLPTSGAASAWLGALLGEADPAILDARLGRTRPDAEGPLFFPHLRLAAAPTPERPSRGAFLGLATTTGAPAMLRAGFEGLAMESARILALMEHCLGQGPARELIVVGGSTRQRHWLALKAAAYGRPLLCPTGTEVTALGAAILAAVGSGVHADLASAAAAMTGRDATLIEPDPTLVAYYAERRRRLHDPLAALVSGTVNPLLLGG